MSKNLSNIKFETVLTRLTTEQYNQLRKRKEIIGIPIAVQIRKAVSDYLRNEKLSKMEGGS